MISSSTIPGAPVSSQETSDFRQVHFALSEGEQRLFFPDGLLPGARWENARALGVPAWNQLLAETRPRVIVTGWSTPALDSSLTTLAGGSVDYVCHVSGAIRHVVNREQIAAGLKVSNWGTLAAPMVAEHALLLVLASLRELPSWREHLCTKSSVRREKIATRTLHGSRVAIHGFGSIAREIIRLIQPFRVAVSVYSDGVPEKLIRAHGATPMPSLRALADDAEILISCEALTPASNGAINASILSALRIGAVFVNVGRGAIVNEPELIEIAAARGLRVATDVFAKEPLLPDSPFLQMPTALLSPHIAGPTRDSFVTCGRHAENNVTRYLSGETPRDLVSLEIFDRIT